MVALSPLLKVRPHTSSVSFMDTSSASPIAEGR
jgi:hypothetical protein